MGAFGVDTDRPLPCMDLCLPGGLDLTDCETVTVSGGVPFSGNVASINGGAMSMDSAISFNIDDATFARNETGSGGAIWAAPITAFTPNISRCTFEENAATDGGAFYLSNSSGINVHVDSSSFRENTAGIIIASPIPLRGRCQRHHPR